STCTVRANMSKRAAFIWKTSQSVRTITEGAFWQFAPCGAPIAISLVVVGELLFCLGIRRHGCNCGNVLDTSSAVTIRRAPAANPKANRERAAAVAPVTPDQLCLGKNS